MSKQSESAGLGGRLRRYAKVSGAVGGLAARVAGERYLGVSFDRANHAAELTADEKNLISHRGKALNRLIKLAQG